MSDIDDVIERLVTDAAFRSELARDPAAALAGYSLEHQDLEILATTLEEGGADEHGVEQRTSKSALVGLIAGLAGGGGGSSPTDDADLAARDQGEDAGRDPSSRTGRSNNLEQLSLSMYDGPEAAEDLAAPGSPDEAGDQVSRWKFERGWPAKGVPAEESVDDLVAPEPEVDERTNGAVSASWDQLAVPTFMPGDTPNPGIPAEGIEGGGPGEPPESEAAESPGDLVPPEPEQADKDHKGWSDVTSSSHVIHEPGVSGAQDISGADAAPSADATSDDEVMYVPVRRTAATAADDLAEPDAPAEAEGNEVAIETVVIQNEGLDPEPDVSVGGDQTETTDANRDVTVKGSKVKQN